MSKYGGTPTLTYTVEIKEMEEALEKWGIKTPIEVHDYLPDGRYCEAHFSFNNLGLAIDAVEVEVARFRENTYRTEWQVTEAVPVAATHWEPEDVDINNVGPSHSTLLCAFAALVARHVETEILNVLEANYEHRMWLETQAEAENAPG